MSFDQTHDRSKTIGGSDAAAVLGLSPFRSPLDVWMEKTGRRKAFTENRYTRLGNLLEPIVADIYAEETGFRVRDPAVTLTHHQFAVISGTPDRIATDSDNVSRVVEVKTAWTPRSVAAWGEPGTSDVPAHYNVQGVIYMALTGLDICDFALFAGGDVKRYTIHRDGVAETQLLETLAAWWDAHVVRDVPPDVTGGDLDLLKTRWGSSSGVMLKATPSLEEIAAKYAAVTTRLAEAEAEADALKATLQSVIADADGIEGETFRATWKFAKASARTDWEAVAKAANASRELIEQNTKIGAASRRFLFKEKS